jgi:CDP-diacylglycerol--glycerol-3-phosphate 3-phosphatidyltransferase
MKVNLPNQITLGRLILAVIFFVLLSRYDQRAPSTTLLDVCFVIFVVAAVTDALDGYLARRQNQVTSLGRILDPLVDKVLLCGAFACFSSDLFVDASGVNVTGVRPWMVVLIFGREFLVTGLRGFSESKGESYAAAVSGKVKMVLQSVTGGVVLAVVAHLLTYEPWVWFMKIMVWLTVVVTTLSMLQYLIRSKAVLAEASRP